LAISAGEGRQQGHWQVIDAITADILQSMEDHTLAGTRGAADDEKSHVNPALLFVLHNELLALNEFLRRILAISVQDMTACCRLYQHGQIAPGRHGEG
jgi:hypothetical protein